jgi:hypothetical protein
MEEILLSVDVAEANVNRTVALAGTSIAIFTFTLVFLYPRVSSGIGSVLFQIALTVIGFAIFSFVLSGICYYAQMLSLAHDSTMAETLRRRADTLWLIGFSLLVLEPSLILFTVGLVAVAAVYLALWVAYMFIEIYVFSQIQSWLRKAK